MKLLAPSDQRTLALYTPGIFPDIMIYPHKFDLPVPVVFANVLFYENIVLCVLEGIKMHGPEGKMHYVKSCSSLHELGKSYDLYVL